MPFHDYSVLAFSTDNGDASFNQSSLMPAVYGLHIAHSNCQSFLSHKEKNI